MINLSRVVIVAGVAGLAEKVCSRLRKPGYYLPVIEAPTVRLVKYGMFDADCIRVSNCVRALKPETVLFLRLDPQVAAKLKGCFPEIQPVSVETFDEALLLNPPSRSSNPRVVERLISAIEAAKRLPNFNKRTAAVNFLEQELLVFASSADFA
jgi:hypothetical protein